MKNNPITINSRNFDGSIRRSWTCELIEANETSFVLVGVFDFDVLHPDLGEIKRGTISYEYYWLDRWYNIFCFHEPDGTFRNYYCNINTPPVFANGLLDYVDLDIDVIFWPNGRFQILDEDEYEQNASKFGFPQYVRDNAATALAAVLELIEKQNLPHQHEILQQKC